MARTTQEIKRQMTDAFMGDPDIQQKYGLKAGDTFASRFSVVSLESILFFIVASAHHILERIFDKFKDDVMMQINRSVVATIPWYHRQALAYQYGDILLFDDSRLQWRYAIEDERKRIVRYVAVKDRGGSIQILASKEQDGLPVPLANDELIAFKHYMNAIKIAGVVLSVRSLPADELSIHARIQLNPLVYSPDGLRIRDGKRPVEDAIRDYLKGITYGGVFNKTRLVDAIQAVEGVEDIELGNCTAQPYGGLTRLISGNNYTARSGCFLASDLTSTISYTY